MYRLLSLKKDWQDTLSISPSVKGDLVWWLEDLDHWIGRVFKSLAPEWVPLETDASLKGWGSRLTNGTEQQKLAQGFWSSEMRQRHSSERETTATLLSLETFAKDLSGKSVLIISENVSSMAGRSERKPHKYGYQNLVAYSTESDRGKTMTLKWEQELCRRPAIPLFQQI